jgi:predicted RNase H-like HicB family nuclease
MWNWKGPEAMLEYHAAFYPVEDGWYMVRVLDFPGVVSQGKTLRSARMMIRDALREMSQWYLEDGKPLPLPKPRAKDKKAVLVESIQLRVQTLAGARQ